MGESCFTFLLWNSLAIKTGSTTVICFSKPNKKVPGLGSGAEKAHKLAPCFSSTMGRVTHGWASEAAQAQQVLVELWNLSMSKWEWGKMPKAKTRAAHGTGTELLPFYLLFSATKCLGAFKTCHWSEGDKGKGLLEQLQSNICSELTILDSRHSIHSRLVQFQTNARVTAANIRGPSWTSGIGQWNESLLNAWGCQRTGSLPSDNNNAPKWWNLPTKAYLGCCRV